MATHEVEAPSRPAARPPAGRSVALLLCIGASAWVCGCNTTPGGDGGGQGSVDLPALPPRDPPLSIPEHVPTTVENIEDAFAAGSLTMEQRLLLEFDAIYRPAQVPAAYAGGPEPSTDHGYLFWLLGEVWPTLSSDAQSALRPFTLPPTDPASFFYPAVASGSRSQLGEVDWEVEALPNDVQLQWPKNPARPDLADRAAAIASAATEVPPKFKALLGFRMTPVVIFLLPASEFSAAEESGDADPTPTGCSVRIRDNLAAAPPLDKDYAAALRETMATTAHELFHCFQFTVLGGLSNDKDVRWLMESTATWSEDYAYPDFQTEQTSAWRYLYRTRWDLLSNKAEHHYGAYMWHLFLAQYVSPAEVDYALLSSRPPSSSPRKMLAGRADFANELAEFAVWNWNREPFTYYRDPPPAIFPTRADDASRTAEIIESAGERRIDVKLGKGAVGYYQIELTNRDLAKLTFDLSGLDAAPGGPTQVTAILLFHTGTFRESWSGLDKVEFCRHLPDQNLGRAIVIVSNADLEKDLDKSFKFKAEEKCGPGWAGSIRMHWRRDDQWSGMSGTMTWLSGESNSGEGVIREKLVYDAARDAFVVKEMTFAARTEHRDSRVKVRDDIGLCGTISESHRSSTWGAGFNQFPDTDPEGTHTRLSGSKPASGRYGGTYDLGFDMFAQSGQFQGVSVTKVVPALYDTWIGIPCAAHIVEEVSPVTDSAFPTPTPTAIDILAGDTTIQGTTTYGLGDAMQGPVTMTVEWQYRKVP